MTDKELQEEIKKMPPEEQKKMTKLYWIILSLVVIIAIIVISVVCCQPKDYEYKITNYEVMQFDDTKGIISIEIKNNTNKKNYCYVMVQVYDTDGTMIAYGESAFTPPPKSTDTYQMTVQSPFGSLRGSTAKIASFNVFDFST